MPQFPNPGRTLTQDQIESIRALLPAPGDPPAVQVQKQAALREVITRLRGTGLSDGAPVPPAPTPPAADTVFGGGRSGGKGVTFSWQDRVDQAVDAATPPPRAVPEGWHDPNNGDDYTDIKPFLQNLGGPVPSHGPTAPPLAVSHGAAPAPRPTPPAPSPAPGPPPMGAAPLRGTGYGTAALADVEQARTRADSPNRGAAFSADPRRRTSPVDARVDAAVEAAMAAVPPPPAPSRGGAAPALLHAPITPVGPELAVSHGRPAAPPLAVSHGAAAPASGSLNFSDYLGGTPPPPARPGTAAAPRGSARPVAKHPPGAPSPTAAASVPASYLGPDVQAQIGATFAGQAPADRLGSGPSQAAAVFSRPPDAPTLERQAIEGLLSGTASAAPTEAPGATETAPQAPAQPSSPEVAAMVDQLLAEARRGGPILDTFRRSAGRKGTRALFGGK